MDVGGRVTRQSGLTAAIPAHDIDLLVAIAATHVRDPLPVRRPSGSIVLVGAVRELAQPGAVRAHRVDLEVPATVGDEGECFAIGRPARLVVDDPRQRLRLSGAYRHRPRRIAGRDRVGHRQPENESRGHGGPADGAHRRGASRSRAHQHSMFRPAARSTLRCDECRLAGMSDLPGAGSGGPGSDAI